MDTGTNPQQPIRVFGKLAIEPGSGLEQRKAAYRAGYGARRSATAAALPTSAPEVAVAVRVPVAPAATSSS